MKYQYCPQCGSALGLKEIGDEGLVPYCENCAEPYFDGFGTCVIAAVVNGLNEVCLLRQRYVSEHHWVMVAGYIHNGELPECAVKREIEEETGQRASEVVYLGSFYHERKELLMLGFIAFTGKNEFAASREVDAAGWFDMEAAVKLVREGSIARRLLLSAIQYTNGRKKIEPGC